MLSRAALYVTIAIFVAGILFPKPASAHNVSKRDASFVQSTKGAAIAPFVYLGAKHMVTGYDHLAFLVGVVFFLYKLKDIVLYVSLFTVGHSILLCWQVFWAASMQTRISSMPLSACRWSTRRLTT
jgi:hypothetical protein